MADHHEVHFSFHAITRLPQQGVPGAPGQQFGQGRIAADHPYSGFIQHCQGVAAAPAPGIGLDCDGIAMGSIQRSLEAREAQPHQCVEHVVPGVGAGRHLAGVQNMGFVIARGQVVAGSAETQRQPACLQCATCGGLRVERFERRQGTGEFQRIDQRPVGCEGGMIEFQCSDSDSAWRYCRVSGCAPPSRSNRASRLVRPMSLRKPRSARAMASRSAMAPEKSSPASRTAAR